MNSRRPPRESVERVRILEYPVPLDSGKWILHKTLERVAADLRAAGVVDRDVLAIDYDDRALYDAIEPHVRVMIRISE